MVLKGIPWFIHATLSDEGFVSMEDLATRWDSPDRARETAPGELGFAPNNHHYTDVTSRLIAARMFQVVHAAQRSMGVGAHATAGPGPHTPGDTAPNLTVSCERGQLERVWEEKTKLTKPKLALQGSDQLVKRQFKLCAGGEIGFIPMKYLVSALPEPGERPWKTTKKSTVDGWDREDEVEERGEPKTCHQLERMHAVFRNTLLMCVLSFPQFGSSTSPGRTWRAGTSGSMVRTSGAVFPRQRTTSWQLPNATHGGRFTRRCMRATPSRRPCCRSGRTHCSGHVRSMRRSRPFPGAAHQPGHPWTTHHLRRARTSPRARGSPRPSLGTKGRVRPPT